MNDETIVRRYSQKPGFVLAAFRQVAVPVFRITVRALTLARKDLPPIPEFLLRAISAEVNTPDEIAALLGLEQRIVHSGLQSLIHSDDIVVWAPSGERSHRLVLTAKGRDTLSQLRMVTPEERTFLVDVDGLTRRAIIPGLRARAVKPVVVRKEGLIEIPAHPRRKPDFDEVIAEAQRFFQTVAQKQDTDAQRDLIEILSVERTERLFRDDVIQLFFRTLDGTETRVEFVVDERLSDEHALALAKANKASQLQLVPQLSDARDVLAEEIGPEILDQAAPSEHTDHLRHETEQAFQAIAALSCQIQDTGSVTERSRLRAELREAQERLGALEAALKQIKVHQVEVYEHPGYLDGALRNAQRRLMIISPWIKAAVVDDEFVKKLDGALTRGVDIYIGYGLDGENNRESDRDREAIAKLAKVADRYHHFRFVRCGDTHAKILVCDDWYVMTSFNWLSFRGDPRMPFRDERGTYVCIAEKVNDLFASYLDRYF